MVWRVAALAALPSACSAMDSLPWSYSWDKFPAAWFGGNGTEWESEAQLREIGRYSMAILGWQHLADAADFTAVVYSQLTQAAIIKKHHPEMPVMVYVGFGWGMGLNAAVKPIMDDPSYEDFWLQSNDGPEFTNTDCQQMGHPTTDYCKGYFWKFSNASACSYYVENLIRPLAVAPMIDGVFFDAVNYGYQIPEVRPWGRPVVNVPNCTKDGGAGCEALLEGTLDVARRSAELLNAHGKVPMFSNAASFVQPSQQKIWLDEARLVERLNGTKWLTYYESARAEQVVHGSLGLDNMLQEGRLGVPGASHAYYRRDTEGALEDVTPHVAAFMLARESYWYYFGSTGWLDKDWEWTELYDYECGRPLEVMQMDEAKSVYTRAYEACNVTLDCTNQTVCKAQITGPGAHGSSSNKASAPPPTPTSSAVFTNGEGNITCFRIPAVTQTHSGALVAFAEARRGSCSDGDSHEIVRRISLDGGLTWGEIGTAAGNESYWVGNPTVVVLESGQLMLLLAVHGPGCTGNCVTGNAIVVSDDEGLTWSAARDITDMMGPAAKARMGPGTALLLTAGPHTGRLLAPASTGTYGADFVMISDDAGATWRPAANGSAAASWPGMDEAQLTTLANGTVLILMRHEAEAWMGKGEAMSHDGGETWSAVRLPWARPDQCATCTSSLPGPNCQSSIATFGGVTYYSGSNSTSHNRARLTIRRSTDSAASWDEGLLIDAGTSAYSCLVSAPLARGASCGADAESTSCGGVLYEKGYGPTGVLTFVRFPLEQTVLV